MSERLQDYCNICFGNKMCHPLHTYKDVTGGGVAFFHRQDFTGDAAAAAAGPRRARIVGVDGDTTGHFTSGGHNRFSGDLRFSI